jgi:chorismate dehydratase
MFTVGTVSYLNSLPLYRPLELSGTVKIVRAVPSLLSRILADGKCDVALIPVIEHFRGVGEQIISDACIGATGDVRSVLLFSRKPILEIETVALDTSSRTSVALLRIILADVYGLRPTWGTHGPDLDAMLEKNHAALLIGDPALEARKTAAEKGLIVLDLAAAWTKLTGLPFVFAAWVTRRGLAPSRAIELAKILNAARDEGLANIDEIVRTNPIATTISPAEIRSYLTESIEHSLTNKHRAGLEEFRLRCLSHGLV